MSDDVNFINFRFFRRRIALVLGEMFWSILKSADYGVSEKFKINRLKFVALTLEQHSRKTFNLL